MLGEPKQFGNKKWPSGPMVSFKESQHLKSVEKKEVLRNGIGTSAKHLEKQINLAPLLRQYFNSKHTKNFNLKKKTQNLKITIKMSTF